MYVTGKITPDLLPRVRGACQSFIYLFFLSSSFLSLGIVLSRTMLKICVTVVNVSYEIGLDADRVAAQQWPKRNLRSVILQLRWLLFLQLRYTFLPAKVETLNSL